MLVPFLVGLLVHQVRDWYSGVRRVAMKNGPAQFLVARKVNG